MSEDKSIEARSKQLRDRLPALDADALEGLVREHNAHYWDEDAPQIDDPTFDVLVEALRRARPSSPVLESLGPSRPAGGGRGTRFGEVQHDRPMLSLDKCYDDDTLMKWAAGVRGGFLVTPKIDGLACALRYDAAGALVIAGTRGDGRIGDDITANARGVEDIPTRLRVAPGVPVEVRGEVYMRLSRFNAKYKGDKANPRNLAAGAIKTKDPKESAAYGLSFFAYGLEGTDAATEHEKVARLEAFGFPVLPFELVDDGEGLKEAFRRFAAKCKELDTETDGVVMKADRVSEQERLGATAHHPRFAIAYKFQGEGAQTTIRRIEWSVRRSGSVNPVAIVDPIFISGVTVTRVSLHNYGYARKMGAGVGAAVEVVRRGGVIPHVERVLSPPEKLIEAPAEWPLKDGAVGIHQDGDFLYLDAPERVLDVAVDRVRHFTRAIDAVGFGDKVLTQLVETGMVKSPADLYRLDVAKLASLERMGEQSARNLVSAIQARRALTLPTFLVALGMDEVGRSVAETLVDHFHALERIRSLGEVDLQGIHGIGPALIDAILRGLREEKAVIDDLLTVVTIVEPKPVGDSGHPLFGKSVVFTGALAKMDRKTAQKRVQAVGGKTPGGVSADLDFLVIGDDGSPLFGQGEKSTKHKAAEKLIAKGAKVEIVSETDFLKLLDRA